MHAVIKNIITADDPNRFRDIYGDEVVDAVLRSAEKISFGEAVTAAARKRDRAANAADQRRYRARLRKHQRLSVDDECEERPACRL